MPVFLLNDHDLTFPHPMFSDPDGLLCAGGDLSVKRLTSAYSHGIFPWTQTGGYFLWFSPDPRMVLFPKNLVVSKSMRPLFNQKRMTVTFDTAFEDVIRACSETARAGQLDSWIDEDFIEAYTDLHGAGLAHSVEVWQDEQLVGGLYGVSLGKCFFGESMFSRVSNASKFGFISLVRWLDKKGFLLIDCQQETRHLTSLGASPIPRDEFLDILRINRSVPTEKGRWIFDGL